MSLHFWCHKNTHEMHNEYINLDKIIFLRLTMYKESASQKTLTEYQNQYFQVIRAIESHCTILTL